jgi:hypothetical protein
MKLRLLLHKECNRTCKGCCNKDWDLDGLPICESFNGYESIMLTGGEPLLNPALLQRTVDQIRLQTDAPIILYTAWKEDERLRLLNTLQWVDGLTLTLHTRKDVEPFLYFERMRQLMKDRLLNKSLRLNVFHGISLGDTDLSDWEVKSGIRWKKDCPLPTDEVFMRLPQQ